MRLSLVGARLVGVIVYFPQCLVYLKGGKIFEEWEVKGEKSNK